MTDKHTPEEVADKLVDVLKMKDEHAAMLAMLERLLLVVEGCIQEKPCGGCTWCDAHDLLSRIRGE